MHARATMPPIEWQTSMTRRSGCCAVEAAEFARKQLGRSDDRVVVGIGERAAGIAGGADRVGHRLVAVGAGVVAVDDEDDGLRFVGLLPVFVEDQMP